MRHFLAAPAVLMLLAFPALGQVTVDLNALDQLKTAPPGKTAPKPAAATSKAANPAPIKSVPAAKPQPGAPAIAKQPPAPLPLLPEAAPPGVTLAPLPAPVAPANKPTTPSPPVLPTGAGTGTAYPGGMRITFGKGQGELSPVSETSLKTLVSQAPKNETVSYNVLAYAPGSPEDPSTARRLSLSRALAVRSVLMGAGVPSARIYVRALGAPSGSATPDRVDVTVLGANSPPPDLALPPPAATATPKTAAPEPDAPKPGAVKAP